MSRRPAIVTQADIARVIRAAKQAGASEVEVKISDHATIVIRIAPSTADQSPLANAPEIVL